MMRCGMPNASSPRGGANGNPEVTASLTSVPNPYGFLRRGKDTLLLALWLVCFNLLHGYLLEDIRCVKLTHVQVAIHCPPF